MAIGYVLIKTNPAMEKRVYEDIKEKNIKEIREVHILFGEYDLIIKLEVDHFSDIATIVTNHVRSADGINETKTLIVHT